MASGVIESMIVEEKNEFDKPVNREKVSIINKIIANISLNNL
jgi:hypothetical protein